MDERVLRALQQWPNVPDIYGWLSLDRRGRWRLRGETISNRKLIDFIGRNYGRQEDGAYAFQNGPQRVFVDLEITPWIADIAHPPGPEPQLLTHTGEPIRAIESILIDPEQDLILCGEPGPALLLDDALPEILPHFVDHTGAAMDDDALAAALAQTGQAGLHLRVAGQPAAPVRAMDPAQSLEAQCGFIAHPQPPEEA